ncbi:MAG TPA: 23S rRNA (pseudouridine(1915)-N(3))-methyltransferase RlmH [Candidatus Paceibacterota bacterium]|nr:23S rRNA (pseudouridine(1915)-N(3))-methyltransferase RlmH [Candidatus Paceibacterota bacterium]
MKISLVVVGKTQDPNVAALVADYSSRIDRYSGFDIVETTDDKLMKNLEKYDRIFLLDEKGRAYRSVEFADFIQKQLNAGIRSAVFVVGGPFGFSDEVRALADGSIALSSMTFPHDLVRAIFLEQLYRAFTILRNEKYHHE